MNEPYSNHLAGESSLYLQQHAHNPVNWYPWSDEAWELAKKENKLVLISIGYSSCHWCHVMEHETFTDTAAARLMNEFFVCIKVDREERPDIDQIYMSAVQLMTGSGGWPLNCFALPDGRPIYGGTYFPKSNWMQLLTQLDSFYKKDPAQAELYADELMKGINHPDIFPITDSANTFSNDLLPQAIDAWKTTFDNIEGGPNRSPKFPLPGNYQFLLRYAVTQNDKNLLDHVLLTLKKMAFGGIYDHLAGGFARYSTDSLWKVPHFEKMLYDNAQLCGLYANAFKVTKDPLFKKIASETIDFLEREMSDGNGGYYSAIDADSEGEEGKYYVWTKEELKKIKLPAIKGDPYSILFDYYNINDHGYWEKGNHILLRNKSDEDIAGIHDISIAELHSFISETNKILYQEREKRVRPALDKKIITSWNALQISQLCLAYQAFGDERYRKMAIDCAHGIMKNAVRNELLLHIRDQKRVDQGYLEDYAFTISAFINLYQVTLEDEWLLQANKFAEETITHYYDEKDGFFYFIPANNTLIARKKEIQDNVIPASNSEIANALFLLGDYFGEEKYSTIARRMAAAIEENIIRHPSSHSNWMNLYMNLSMPFSEIVIVGPNAYEYINELSTRYLPNALFAGAVGSASTIPLLEDRFQPGRTLIYICRNRTCNLPVENMKDALSSIMKNSNNP